MATQKKTRRGRPSKYTPALAEAICDRLAEGESLRKICKDQKMPAARNVHVWVEENDEFRQQYARAREAQADKYAQEIIEIADEECVVVKHPKEGEDVEVAFDSALVANKRLRVDARKWAASKLAPKKYGDKLDLEVNANINTTLTLADFYGEQTDT